MVRGRRTVLGRRDAQENEDQGNCARRVSRRARKGKRGTYHRRDLSYKEDLRKPFLRALSSRPAVLRSLQTGELPAHKVQRPIGRRERERKNARSLPVRPAGRRRGLPSRNRPRTVRRSRPVRPAVLRLRAKVASASLVEKPWREETYSRSLLLHIRPVLRLRARIQRRSATAPERRRRR